MASWRLRREMILTIGEIRRVLEDLHRKSARSVNSRMNLVIFRLSACCGLRASELCGLALDDVRVASDRPTIRVPKAIAKGKKARVVPLTFDAGTLNDLRAWKIFRQSQGARGSDLFVCSQHRDTLGHKIDRRNARMRFKVACKCLGGERQSQLTIHHGRHSFISHALHGKKSIVEVRDAAGHASLATTSLYAHLVSDDDDTIGNLFS
ncbi:MAG: site-specific integrase [Planctomycetota bacterium]|nr:MAG: site-specific integrase [Planctomycetota bacterium]